MQLIRWILILTVLFCSLAGCKGRAAEPCDCESINEAHPAASKHERYALPGLDHGLVQSPVNILTDNAVDQSHRVALHFDHAAPDLLLNKGYTIELDFPEGSTITYDQKAYELQQLHFHTPSEHQVDGVTYPMEMHIVNRASEEFSDGLPHYLVIAVFFKMGDDNHFISGFLDAVPPHAGEKKPLGPGTIYLDELFPGHKVPSFFHYRGSLTTPPHTETVDWLVLKRVAEASPEQIRRINEIEGDNARHVQALYGRPIDD